MSETLRGQLLVAAPILRDPNFHRTVVLVAEHGEEGAMGLVLNRPTDTPVEAALPELAQLTGDGDPVYVGGPVSLESVIAVAELDDPDDASELLFDTVGFVQEPDVAAVRGRGFVGYAGLCAGQHEEGREEDRGTTREADQRPEQGENCGGREHENREARRLCLDAGKLEFLRSEQSALPIGGRSIKCLGRALGQARECRLVFLARREPSLASDARRWRSDREEEQHEQRHQPESDTADKQYGVHRTPPR